jgi:hypothetical protein
MVSFHRWRQPLIYAGGWLVQFHGGRIPLADQCLGWRASSCALASVVSIGRKDVQVISKVASAINRHDTHQEVGTMTLTTYAMLVKAQRMRCYYSITRLLCWHHCIRRYLHGCVRAAEQLPTG